MTSNFEFYTSRFLGVFRVYSPEYLGKYTIGFSRAVRRPPSAVRRPPYAVRRVPYAVSKKVFFFQIFFRNRHLHGRFTIPTREMTPASGSGSAGNGGQSFEICLY